MNKKHYLVYFNSTGEILITTEPRTWNRSNPTFLSKHNARTIEIENYLLETFQFQRAETDRAIVFYKMEAMNFQ